MHLGRSPPLFLLTDTIAQKIVLPGSTAAYTSLFSVPTKYHRKAERLLTTLAASLGILKKAASKSDVQYVIGVLRDFCFETYLSKQNIKQQRTVRSSSQILAKASQIIKNTD